MDISASLNKLVIKGMGDSIEVGFHDPSIFIDTGNYALNKIISGDFNKGFPMGKTMILAGESGAGKSYLACSIMREAQKKGILPVILDSESALDRSFLQAIGVNTDPENLLYFGVTTVAQCQNIISKVLQGLDTIKEEDRKPILFVIDSLGMLLTEKEAKEFDAGTMKADMGTKAKQLRLFFRMVTNAIAKYEAGVIATNHTYKGSDMYGNSVTSISGGEGLIYAASIVLMVTKKEIKENGMAPTEGIYVNTKCIKTRFTKPFQRVSMELPYASGLDPYSGLFDKVKETDLLLAAGSWYTIKATGEKFQGEKGFKKYADYFLTLDFDFVNIADDSKEVDKISAAPNQLKLD